MLCAGGGGGRGENTLLGFVNFNWKKENLLFLLHLRGKSLSVHKGRELTQKRNKKKRDGYDAVMYFL